MWAILSSGSHPKGRMMLRRNIIEMNIGSF
jgi:hypothetical protein